MPTKTIRVRSATHKALREIAQLTGRPMDEVLARAVEEERRRLCLGGPKADYEALRKELLAAAELNKAMGPWDRTDLGSLEHP